jgi:hypothetical protein
LFFSTDTKALNIASLGVTALPMWIKVTDRSWLSLRMGWTMRGFKERVNASDRQALSGAQIWCQFGQITGARVIVVPHELGQTPDHNPEYDALTTYGARTF